MDGDRESRGPVVLVTVLFVVGSVLGVLGVLLWDTVDDSDGASTTARASSRSDAGQTDAGVAADSEWAQGMSDNRAERCSQATDVLRGPVEAARPALRQWDVHVDAMNDLVRGEITLQQATRFWNRTRLGAQRNIDHFGTAYADAQRTGVDCPAPDLMGPSPATVRSCARRVTAELGVLRAARTSIDTWDSHVHHMDMLRMGTMSPQEATDLWLTMWQRGVRDLDAYRAAARNPALSAECRPPR